MSNIAALGCFALFEIRSCCSTLSELRAADSSWFRALNVCTEVGSRMSKVWFLRKGGSTYGPLSSAKLKAAAAGGKVTADDEIANSKEGPWFPAAKLSGLNINPKTTAKRQKQIARTRPIGEQGWCDAPSDGEAGSVPTPSAGPDTRAVLQYQARAKSVVLAYALWFFLGGLGAHRIYCGKTASGVAMLVASISSVILCLVLIGFIGVVIVAIWVLIDAFLVHGWVQKYNTKLADSIGT